MIAYISCILASSFIFKYWAKRFSSFHRFSDGITLSASQTFRVRSIHQHKHQTLVPEVEEFNQIKSFAWIRFVTYYLDQKIMMSSKLSKFNLLWNSRLSTANSSWCSLSLRWIGDSIDVSFAAWDADLVRKDDNLSAMECDRYCAPMIMK